MAFFGICIDMDGYGVAMVATILFRLDTLKQSAFDTVQHRVVVNDCQVLRLCLKLLVGVGTRAKHVWSLSSSHTLHLLSHLTGSYQELA
jgi:hypothetical protein